MATEELLAYEARVRPRQAAIAAAAALLLLLAPLVGLAGPRTKVDELTLDLLTIHRRFPLDLIAAVVQAIGLLALADTLGWLDGRARARNPQQKAWMGWAAMVGASLFAIGVAGGEAAVSSVASEFASNGAQTYLQAHALMSSGFVVILPVIEQLGALLLALGFILVALNAMRVGLLPRYLGFIGVGAGALVLIPVVPVPVVACFWLGAVAALLVGRWLSGMPPAWTTGTSVPWPPSAPRGAPREPRQASEAPRTGRRQAAAPVPADRPATAVPERTRATTPKRKRKHRS
jgi:MFS family permease